jgi:hypothetical protein
MDQLPVFFKPLDWNEEPQSVASAHESTSARFASSHAAPSSSPPPDYFDSHFSYFEGPADLGDSTHPLPTTTNTASTKAHKTLLADEQCALPAALLDAFDDPLNDLLFDSELHGFGFALPPGSAGLAHPPVRPTERAFSHGFEPLPPYEDAAPTPMSKSDYSCAPTPPQAGRATRASPAPCPADDKRNARRKKNRGYQQASRSRKAAMAAEMEQQKFLMRYFALSVRQLVHKDLIGGAHDLNQFCKDLVELELRCGLDLEPGSVAK